MSVQCDILEVPAFKDIFLHTARVNMSIEWDILEVPAVKDTFRVRHTRFACCQVQYTLHR